jgi:hypothetical protein
MSALDRTVFLLCSPRLTADTTIARSWHWEAGRAINRVPLDELLSRPRQTLPVSGLTDRCQAIHHGLGRLKKGAFARGSRDRRSEYCHRCTTKSGAKRGRTRHVNLARTDFLLDRLLC